MSIAAGSLASAPMESQRQQPMGDTPGPGLTFFLFPPLKLQHHVIVPHESMHRRVQVKDIPEQQTVLSAELGDHHCHQPVAERLERETPSWLTSGSYAPMLPACPVILSFCH